MFFTMLAQVIENLRRMRRGNAALFLLADKDARRRALEIPFAVFA